MKIKALLLIIIIGLVLAYTCHFIAIAAIDAPHNEANSVSCGSCHGQGLLQSFWGGSGLYSTVDELCLSCHKRPFCPYTDDDTPQSKTHLDSDENALAECRTCHDPHYQKQKNYKNTDASNLYLAYGTIINCSYYPPVPPDTVGTSTLTYSSIAYKTGWDAVKLTGKTDTCRCTILFPNVKKLGYSYPIIGIDEGENTITVKGDVTPVYQYITSSDFAVLYGQYIRDNINGKAVKFFCPCGENSFADGDGIYDSICEVCHTQPDAPHFAGTRCTDCHNHPEGLSKPSNDCIGCHSYSFGGRAAIAQQFETNSHHVQGVTLEITHCYECHWEANTDGSINNPYHEGYNTDTESYVPGAKVDLVVYDVGTRPTTYIDGTTAIQYIANGSRAEIGELNTHCLSCHSDQNDTTEPFGDGKTPKQYAWDSKSIDERYSQAGTTTWGKYSGTKITPKDTKTKAYSAHGNAINNQGGWDLNETWPNTRNGSEIVACFDCHNSHGSTVSGTTTSYASATTNGGILKDINTGKGGYSITYKPQAGGSVENKNPYNAGAGLCFDCHMNANEGATPWGYNSTFMATQPIMGYWDTPYFGTGISGPKQRFVYKSSMSHKGGHLGASYALSGSPTGTINGICTPCHDPHGVSPNLGATQQYAVPLLKGTWITSPYKEDVAPAVNTAGTVRDSTYPVGAGSPYSVGVQYHIDQNTFGANIRASVTGITQTDTQFAGLCLNCHTKNSLTDGINGGTWKSIDRIHESVKGWGANVKHKYICSKCHAPHSTRLPRLMVTNCLNSTHKGRTNYNPSPVTSGVGSGDDTGCYGMADIPAISRCSQGEELELYLFDSGGGAFPGSWHSPDWGNYGVTCHESESADQSWNVKTEWAQCTPTISAGPTAGSFTAIGSNVQATITWTTDYPSTSYVDYGLTSSYGSTTGNAVPVTNHSITLTNLTNHSTYNYRVRSSCLGTETVSGNYTFDISLSPTVPGLTNPLDFICLSNCLATLLYSSTDPDDGTIEYFVEIDTNNPPVSASADYQSYGWTTQSSWAPSLATNTVWYWRVQARDGNHTEAISAWSATDSFLMSDGIAPPAPTLVSPPNGANRSDYYCGSAWIVFSWNAVPPIAEYYVEVDTTTSFDSANLQSLGWTTNTSWGAALSTLYSTWYWRVQARDAFSYETGPWSSTWSFTITDLGCASSCPFVYVWNGSSYNYLTDLAGELLARGAGSKEKVVEDTELYGPNFFVLNGLVRDEDNNYKVKVRETIGEADYFDQAKLLLVDHPAGYEVSVSTPAETYVYGYPTPFQVYAVKDARPPVTATDKYGSDVTDSLTAVDGETTPVDLEGEDYYTLDFGNIEHPEYAKLLIDGWTVINKSVTYPATGGSPSYVEVIDENGNWVAVNTAGRPQGDLKTMVVDLSGLFKSSDHRIRFHAGTRRRSKMITDRIRLSDSAPVPVDIREVVASSADLHHRGADRVRYASLIGRITAEDATLPDQTNSYLYGAFTAYGDVTSLLSDSDDMYAIMRHGDELTMIFPDAAAPPDGWERSIIFKADVFYKGLATGTSIDPLPFHGMSIYPYDPAVEHYPDDAEHQQYLIEFNTRAY